MIATLISADFVSMTLDQSGFLSDDNVLSTWILVSVMDD